jgi:hypothetical protein
MEEFRAATRDGPRRVIPVKIADARMPPVLDGISYASHTASGTDAVAIHVSQALAARIGRPEDLGIPQDLQSVLIRGITAEG